MAGFVPGYELCIINMHKVGQMYRMYVEDGCFRVISHGRGSSAWEGGVERNYYA